MSTARPWSGFRAAWSISTNMASEYPVVDFLGRGWSFPVNKSDGDIRMSADEEKITQAVWLILATAPGERAMRPDFGCGIHSLVFSVSNAATIGRASEMVRQALVRWEPRVDVLDVTAESRGHGELLLINIR